MSMRLMAVLAVSSVCGLAVASQSRAAQPGLVSSPWTEVHSSRVRLVAGSAKTAKGQYFAGLEIVMADGWKTYWRMPGDSGVPPNFDWSGSQNIGAVKVLYPAPTRMPEAGGEAIGYKQSVVLPIQITPENATKPVALKLALEFGLCREICIPATTAFDLLIPSGAAGAPAPEIASALERVPRPKQDRRQGDPELKSIAVTGVAPSQRLTIEAKFPGTLKGADVFVEAPEGLYVPLPKRAGNSPGSIRFETDLGRDLAQDLKGKTLTITLVSDKGAAETQWKVP